MLVDSCVMSPKIQNRLWASVCSSFWIAMSEVNTFFCIQITFTCTPFSRYHLNAFMPHVYNPHGGMRCINQIDRSLDSRNGVVWQSWGSRKFRKCFQELFENFLIECKQRLLYECQNKTNGNFDFLYTSRKLFSNRRCSNLA